MAWTDEFNVDQWDLPPGFSLTSFAPRQIEIRDARQSLVATILIADALNAGAAERFRRFVEDVAWRNWAQGRYGDLYRFDPETALAVNSRPSVSPRVKKAALAFAASALVTAVFAILFLNFGVRLLSRIERTAEHPITAPAPSKQAPVQVEVSPQREAVQKAGGPRRFAVSLGAYSHSEAAEAQARAVRSKGYLASVAPTGTQFLVVTRPYENAVRARQWCRIFADLGLPGRLVAWSALNQLQ